MFLASLARALFPSTFPFDARGNALARALTLEVCAVKVTVIFLAGGFACEPQAADVGAEVLVALQCEAGRPVGVATASPGCFAPARIHEVDRVRDGGVAEHLAKDDEDLGFGDIVGLSFEAVGLVCHDGHDEDAAAGEELGDIERLGNGVVAAGWGGVEEVLVVGLPEDLVGREL